MKDMCIYCEDKNKAEHFICCSCGCGMCENCYNGNIEHDEHLFDFHESVENEAVYKLIVEETGSYYGYLCFDCLDKFSKKINIGGKNG